MTNRIVVAGDVHLGSENADVDAFNGFLDDVYRNRSAVAEVVFLGDLWDLVRRDPFGCAWETTETIARLKRLGEALPVRYVLGNHDACLRGLDPSRYDIDLREEYVIEGDDWSIRFCHGNAFDRLQFDAVSDYLSGPGDRGDIDPTKGRKDPLVAGARRCVRAGKARLRSIRDLGRGSPSSADVAYPRRERRAHAYLETIPEDKLVYGHTHAPYVHPDNSTANPGSWKSTAPIHDTYLVVEAGRIELYRYRSGGDDERID